MIKFLSTSLPSAVTASKSYSPLFRHSRALSLSSLLSACIAVSFNSISNCYMSSSIRYITSDTFTLPTTYLYLYSSHQDFHHPHCLHHHPRCLHLSSIGIHLHLSSSSHLLSCFLYLKLALTSIELVDEL